MLPGGLEWVIILIIVLVLFGGRGRISSIFGELGSGISAFRKGLKESDDPNEKQIEDGKKE